MRFSSKISSAVTGTDAAYIFSAINRTNRQHGHVFSRSCFKAAFLANDGILFMWFERDGERKKRVCFFPLPFNPNYLWSNYPARVYAFFSRTLWPCCGCSEVWTHYRSCLPPKHTIKTPPAPPFLQDCHQSQMWSHKRLSWYVRSEVELCHKYVCIKLTICTHSFKHLCLNKPIVRKIMLESVKNACFVNVKMT